HRAELAVWIGLNPEREAIAVARHVFAALRTPDEPLPPVDGGERIREDHVLREPTDERELWIFERHDGRHDRHVSAVQDRYRAWAIRAEDHGSGVGRTEIDP